MISSNISPVSMLSLVFFFFFKSSGPHRDLPSSPTRRSPDLGDYDRRLGMQTRHTAFDVEELLRPDIGAEARFRERSEEHTSELQSQSNLVCRLLLEKKNSLIIVQNMKQLRHVPHQPLQVDEY